MNVQFTQLIKRLIRFGVVGLTNTFLTFSIFSVLVLVGIPYKISIVITGVLGVLYSSLLNKSFTFERQGHHHTISFVGVYVLTVGLNLVLIDYGVIKLNMDPIIVQAILVLPLAALTFALLWVVDNYIMKKLS